ncbi:hypothetical protein [Aquibacillus albus]|uniref:Uncharacterized protein n=1 Tax=Aquibacillus albus TaxID=1168171 RepID=A0ABS2MYP3_9BACI|nr:hypothetical protein [Aquibacillus albus]MBM7570959.1 hypothetical protein [Aquibacillus albus]
MNSNEINDLKSYKTIPVELCIHGETGEETAPWVKRKIIDITYCPDKTHLRLYFDKHFFIAIPLSSDVQQKRNNWIAFDKQARLYYAIRRGEDLND